MGPQVANVNNNMFLATSQDVVGWSYNARGFEQCWFGAGLPTNNAAAKELCVISPSGAVVAETDSKWGCRGSALCPGLPNGSQWARVWFR